MIVPQHVQHYPDLLLPKRLEEFVVDDGPPQLSKETYGKMLTGTQIVRQLEALGSSIVSAEYYIGTCFHEAGCTNEWDTEVAKHDEPTGFVSVGAFQIGEEEAHHFGFTLIDMLDLEKATVVMKKLAEDHRDALRWKLKLGADAMDPLYVDPSGMHWPGGQMRAYLAVAHNTGLATAMRSVDAWGMDWNAFKLRNPKMLVVSHGYGDDCITGGPEDPRK